MLAKSLVREWMTSPVITVTPDTSISLAHKIMKDNGVRRLVVVDPEDYVKGIITIGDVREASPSDAVTLSIWELNYLWAQLTVEKIMTSPVMTVQADEPILNAAKLMLAKKVSGLPVVDAAGRVVGMLTESDIFRLVVSTIEEDQRANS
ncbi:MAG TPA: CBS domain-containing protein [Aggregatilineales bacterium]|jgi:CBS domain-containing protein|nr:CBS domain-containing protein [Aggregatilineales bacterium]